MSHEELAEYRSHLEEVLRSLDDESIDNDRRQELEQERNDLTELIALLDDEPEKDADDDEPEKDADDDEPEKDADDDETLEVGDITGERCRAPFPSTSNQSIRTMSHNAVVLEVAADESQDCGEIMVRVLYSQPMEEKQKACDHFLRESCKFGDQCRRSHGELVKLADLQDYVDVSHDEIGVDSLLLIHQDNPNGLWEIGELVSRDGDRCAVRLRKTGKEVERGLHEILPLTLDNDAPAPPESSTSEERFPELKASTYGSASVADIGQFAGGGSDGVGLKLMQKMGYRIGQGLGRKSDGIVHAIQAVVLPKNKSLDYIMEQKAKKRKFKTVDGIETERERKRREAREKREALSAEENDIFAFINRRSSVGHHGGQAAAGSAAGTAEEWKTSGSVHVDAVRAEDELRELRRKEQRLVEGVQRNAVRDPPTAARIDAQLGAIRRQIKSTEARHRKLGAERDARKGRPDKMKDVF